MSEIGDLGRELAARDAELAALRKQVEVLKASRKAWVICWKSWARHDSADLRDAKNADAACRAAGVEVED